MDDAAEHDMSFSTDDASHSDASEVGDTDSADTGMDSGTSPAPLGGAQPWEDCEGGGATVEAGPDTYRDALAALEPGDTLLLQPGTYTRGLPFRNSGEPERCIIVRPLDPSDRPLFEGSDSFNPRPELEGMPTGENDTIIRWNVFSKNARSPTGSSARPNLLLGHLPTSGTGQHIPLVLQAP